MSELRARIRVATWNLHCGVLFGPDDKVLSDSDAQAHVQEQLHLAGADVVALQEVPFDSIDSSRPSLLAPIVEELGYGYESHATFSWSHLLENKAMGLSILSRCPLVGSKRIVIPNPRLRYWTADGAERLTHDKGFLVSNLRLGESTTVIASTHLFPFHSFGRTAYEDCFRPIWETVSTLLLGWSAGPAIVCGDFNAERIADVLPGIFVQSGYRAVLEGPTRYTGSRHDQILVTNHWSFGKPQILQTASDHHLCIAELETTDFAGADSLNEREP